MHDKIWKGGTATMEEMNSRQKNIWFLFSVVLLAAMIFHVTGLPVAAEQAALNSQAISKQAPAQPSAQGMRAFIDPTTGKLREPTEEEQQKLTPQLAPSSKKTVNIPVAPKMKSGPGNAVGMSLDESYMVHSVATINPDGSISTECVTGRENAEKALTAAPRPGQPAGKEDSHEK
jgi:hypothetical protein